MPKKYRILKIENPNTDTKYYVQRKTLCAWVTETYEPNYGSLAQSYNFGSESKAREFIERERRDVTVKTIIKVP